MILSDLEIRMEIGSGRLRFTPEIEWDQITPSSVDLRLGNEFTHFRREPVGAETIVDLRRVGNIEEIAARYGDRSVLAPGEAFRLTRDNSPWHTLWNTLNCPVIWRHALKDAAPWVGLVYQYTRLPPQFTLHLKAS